MIALVGLPGSGKTTVGRQLARRLGWAFVDSDHVIEARVGCSVRAFFEREGEAAFRDIEAQVLQELSLQTQQVLSTGGGAVLRPENRACLRAGGTVVYLKSSPAELFRRLRNDTQRPLLQVADPAARLQTLFDERDPLYQATAHVVLDTAPSSVGMLVNRLLTQLDLPGRTAPTA